MQSQELPQPRVRRLAVRIATSGPWLVTFGAVLIVIGLFLPVVHCESSIMQTCTKQNASMFQADFFDESLSDGIAENTSAFIVMVAALVAIIAAATKKGMTPVGLTLVGFVAYQFYRYWYEAERGLQSSELSLAPVGWIVLFLGAALAMGGAFIQEGAAPTSASPVQNTISSANQEG
jgi:hypothetical protein